jgi:hypothetical protein
VRRFGTSNFPDYSNLCHEATSVGLPENIGIGKGTVLLEDFDATEAIFVIGQNPGTNSPRMMTSLRAARSADPRHQPAARARAGALRGAAGPGRDGDLEGLTRICQGTKIYLASTAVNRGLASGGCFSGRT